MTAARRSTPRSVRQACTTRGTASWRRRRDVDEFEDGLVLTGLFEVREALAVVGPGRQERRFGRGDLLLPRLIVHDHDAAVCVGKCDQAGALWRPSEREAGNRRRVDEFADDL